MSLMVWQKSAKQFMVLTTQCLRLQDSHNTCRDAVIRLDNLHARLRAYTTNPPHKPNCFWASIESLKQAFVLLRQVPEHHRSHAESVQRKADGLGNDNRKTMIKVKTTGQILPIKNGTALPSLSQAACPKSIELKRYVKASLKIALSTSFFLFSS